MEIYVWQIAASAADDWVVCFPPVVMLAHGMGSLHTHSSFPLPKFLRRFVAMESAAGIVMLVAAALALIAANGPLSDAYKTFITTPFTFGMNDALVTEPLKIWVKDIFMVFFFLLIGLELKREMTEGVLATWQQRALPLIAAAGGMAVPALMYLFLNRHTPENAAGWAIPAATDIAFALCVLTLMGRGVPVAVKIFLLAIAIFDDLGAILIIAFFYSGALALSPLLLAAIGIAALVVLNRLRVSLIAPYVLVGVYLWFCLYHANIHTTLAGVLVGLMLPMRCAANTQHSPVNQAIHFLHPWVGFFVLPLFAFTSAGVSVSGMTLSDAFDPLPLGIALALFFGKQIGIFGATWLAEKAGFAKLPEGASWPFVYGVSVLAGIGFTMSLFIGALAFPESQQNEVTLGVMGGSVLAAAWGAVVMRWALSKPSKIS